MSLSRQLQAVVTAVQFLTRIPLPGGMNGDSPDLTLMRAAVIYFPLVGGMIGLIAGCAIRFAAMFWTSLIAVILGLILEAMITGAFHEDAVADSCDAFGGGWTREDVLRIMKDSRIGSFGALGLMLAVALRAACTVTLPLDELIAGVVAAAAIGRWGVLIVSFILPPVPKRDGLAKDMGEQLTVRELGLGTLCLLPGLIACFALHPMRTLAGGFAVVVFAALWSQYVRRRIGGVTGDCLGTACYLGQCVFLLCLTAGRLA